MKRYLVFCKNQKQWDDYVETHMVCVKYSKIMEMYPKDNSFSIFDNYGNTSVYIKMIPSDEYIDTVPITYKLLSEKIWLCDKKEFVDLAWVDKYL